MSTLNAGISEAVYALKKWQGVNENPDGDGNLKDGEAAAMRNFRITDGGALKKRPGTAVVAGLMQNYVPQVSATAKKIFTELGTAEDYPMYPYISFDSVGAPVLSGEAASINRDNAEEHSEDRYWAKGRYAYELSHTVIRPASGSIMLEGGAGEKDSLAVIATGSETNVNGAVETSGKASLTVHASARCSAGTWSGAGDASEIKRVTGDGGWMSQDVGGYVSRSGEIWQYYGQKAESALKGYRYGKYACTRAVSYYSYYEQSAWVTTATFTPDGDDYYGYSSYSFKTATGEFTFSGSATLSSSATSGTIYYGSASTLFRLTASASGWTEARKTVQGPYIGSSSSYTVGSLVDSLVVLDTSAPEPGYSYVTRISSGGKTYIVAKTGSDYYAYTRDTTDDTEYYSYEWAFYGYPLTLTADEADFYFFPVAAVSNSADSVVRGIWSGFVGRTEYIVAACCGYLWSLAESGGVWSKTAIGAIDTAGHVCLFGFDEKLYCLDGTGYYSWDGTVFGAVSGYIPCLASASAPGGGGTLLERANMLTPKRRQLFSSDGTSTVYTLLEQNLVSIDAVTVDGNPLTSGYTADLSAGTVRFSTAPAAGSDNVEIQWTAAESSRSRVTAMRFAELYNGVSDSRVFLYGDGSNTALYSDLTETGQPSAEYFPELNEIAVGDANTPLTAMIRQYSRLMAFKAGSAWSICYDAITLVDGSVTAGFYCNPVNRSIGNDAPGQVCLVENRPRTLDGRSVYEWVSTSSSGYVTNDQRNAKRVSQNVENTLLGFDLSRSILFFDKINHEFYCVYDGTAAVQNTETGAWYIYTAFPAVCLINYKDDLYYGTGSGELRRFSDDYTSDGGEVIDAYWESGSLSFGKDYVLKYSPTVWVGLTREPDAAVSVGIITDAQPLISAPITADSEQRGMPHMRRVRLKARRFTHYKLVLFSQSAGHRATVTAADIRVKYNINVK